MTLTQIEPSQERENVNLIAKYLTSKNYSKKLSNQEQSWQFIQNDSAQYQQNMSQLQINLPNKDIISTDSCYTQIMMQLSVNTTNQSSPMMQLQTGNYCIIVQYKFALYCISFPSSVKDKIGTDVVQAFKQAIEDTQHKTNKNLTNTEDYGMFVYIRQANPGTTGVLEYVDLGFTSGTVQPVPADATTQLLDTFNIDTTPKNIELYAKGEQVQMPDGSILDNPVSKGQVFSSMQLLIGYQKIANLGYSSPTFVKDAFLQMTNSSNNQEIQMKNVDIFRQQYDPNVNEEYQNNHYYEFYGNTQPKIIYATQLTQDNQFSFTFPIYIQACKLWDLFQNEFIPLGKLSNPLRLTICLNTALIQDMFKVKTLDSTIDGDVLYDVQFIQPNQIVYYNMGMFILSSSDTMASKKLTEELQSSQGIILPITKRYVSKEGTYIGDNKQFMISYGYNSLDKMELGLYFTNNRDYYRGFSVLGYDLSGQYASLTQVGCKAVSPQKDSLDALLHQITFYQPQVYINNKQLFIGSNFINSLPFFNSINNRRQTYSDSNPYCQDQFQYFNKCTLSLSQFTDTEVSQVYDSELNFSGQMVEKMGNNYFTTNIANYMVSNYQSDLREVQSTDTILNGEKTYNVECIYHFKVICKIQPDGTLIEMAQQYNM